MKLNEKLHLVVPLQDYEDRVYAHIHSAPVTNEAFKANYLLCGKVFGGLVNGGFGPAGAPRIAKLMYDDYAVKMGVESQAKAFLDEVFRLTNVVFTSGPDAWRQVPYYQASKQLIAEDADTVENLLIFFTVFSAMRRGKLLKETLEEMATLYGAELSSSNCTAFVAGLRTSTATDSTGESQTPALQVAY